MIENLLRESASLQDTEARSQMIHEIAKHASKEVVDELILILQDTQSPLIPVALEVLEIIGYPKNASAIPAILWYIDNGTSPLFEKALQFWWQWVLLPCQILYTWHKKMRLWMPL